MPPAFTPLLQRWLPEYGCAPQAELTAHLARFLDLMVAAQARVRLVGSVDPEELVRRHVGESIALLRSRPLRGGALADIGSGAGFPGIVLALAVPALETTLVESTSKKAAFLQSAVVALHLEARVRVVNRFLPRQRPPGEQSPVSGASLVTIRALEHMEDVPRWLGRWLDFGAEAAFWVTRARADQWRHQFSHWHWGEFTLLPGAHSRGILFGSTVPRETPA